MYKSTLQNLSANSPTPSVFSAVTFNWSNDARASYYEIELTKNVSDASSTITEVSTSASYTLTYGSGLKAVSARVKACDYKDACGDFSSAVNVIYKPSAPDSIQADNTSPEYWNVGANGDSVTITWTPSSIVDDYVINFTKNSSAIGPIHQSSNTYTISYENGLRSITNFKVLACNMGVCSNPSTAISLTYTSSCGNGIVESTKGEQCDPGVFINNDSTKRCVPNGESYVFDGSTRFGCEWYQDLDNDDHEGDSDCNNSDIDPEAENTYPESDVYGTDPNNQIDYNCNGEIDVETVVSCIGGYHQEGVNINYSSGGTPSSIIPSCSTPCNAESVTNFDMCINDYPSHNAACESLGQYPGGGNYLYLSCGGSDGIDFITCQACIEERDLNKYY